VNVNVKGSGFIPLFLFLHMSNYGFEGLGFYPASMKLWDLCRQDSETLCKDYRGKEISAQLIRSAGSIPANIEEGYGRISAKEYIRYLTYTLGSARESRGWYKKSNRLLSARLIKERINLIAQIIGKVHKTIRTLKKK